MPFRISEQKRKLWIKRAKDFWLDYSHNLTGIAGIAILVLFICIAVFAPFIAPLRQDSVRLVSSWQADKYAVPEWLGIFSREKADWPVTTVYARPSDWTVQEPVPASITWDRTINAMTFHYNASESGSNEPVSVHIMSTFDYPYKPMRRFALKFSWKGTPDEVVTVTEWNRILKRWMKVGETGSMAYMIELTLITPNGTSYAIWDQNWWKANIYDPRAEPAFWTGNISRSVTMPSNMGPLAEKLGYMVYDPVQATMDMFSSKGLYTLDTRITFKPGEIEGVEVPLQNATGSVTFSPNELKVWGRRWGLLGTDGYGHDVFSQLIYGAAISLTIGISAAVIGTVAGLLVGIVAGYLGGMIDETLMRIVDILLCLPILPILIVLIAVFGYSTYYIILIIAVFGWQGLSRLVRSQVLSIRETAFIESAKASGASKSHIILRHIFPNVLPIALTRLVLAVPGAIILEAALSFIGMGDPTAPTWGKMLYFARVTGGFSSLHLAWWDVFPPGFAITFLCLAFVFMGHAVDEIVNPRLRRRR